MQRVSKSIQGTAEIAAEILKSLKPTGKATVLALYGNLGSGKTTFVQELGKLLGVKEIIQSPTFVIMKTYTLHAKPYTLFTHIDAYRLEKEDELARLGWKEILDDPETIIAVEWAERVEGLVPENAKRIRFRFVDDVTREISVD